MSRKMKNIPKIWTLSLPYHGIKQNDIAIPGQPLPGGGLGRGGMSSLRVRAARRAKTESPKMARDRNSWSFRSAKTPKGQNAPANSCLEFCEAASMEAGCMDSWVFALQKPKAKKWHGHRNPWSFAKQNSERSNCAAV
jgi:hypothetical protein